MNTKEKLELQDKIYMIRQNIKREQGLIDVLMGYL